MDGPKACDIASPYIDEHGESKKLDFASLPQYLSKERYDYVQRAYVWNQIANLIERDDYMYWLGGEAELAELQNLERFNILGPNILNEAMMDVDDDVDVQAVALMEPDHEVEEEAEDADEEDLEDYYMQDEYMDAIGFASDEEPLEDDDDDDIVTDGDSSY